MHFELIVQEDFTQKIPGAPDRKWLAGTHITDAVDVELLRGHTGVVQLLVADPAPEPAPPAPAAPVEPPAPTEQPSAETEK